MKTSLHLVMDRCIGWDTPEMMRLGCQQRVWLVDGDVWERATTVQVLVEGHVAQSTVARCGNWGACGACWELAGAVRFALPRHTYHDGTALNITVLPTEGGVEEIERQLQLRGLRLRSAVTDGAQREQRWPLPPGAAGGAAGGPQGDGAWHLRVRMEAGAPPRLLRKLAAALGDELSQPTTAACGGREVEVRRPDPSAALLEGAALQYDGWAAFFLVGHSRGAAGVLQAVKAAHAKAGAGAGTQREELIAKLQKGERVHAGVQEQRAEKLRELHAQATSAGCARAVLAGQQAMELLKAPVEEPVALQHACQELQESIAARLGSIDREMDADGDDGAQKQKDADLLRKEDAVLKEAARDAQAQASVDGAGAHARDVVAHFMKCTP
eukprot:gene742-3123_t